jgi:aspartate aminotransferase-like enzyme
MDKTPEENPSTDASYPESALDLNNIPDAFLYAAAERENCTCKQYLTRLEQEGGAISVACEFHHTPRAEIIRAAREIIREKLAETVENAFAREWNASIQGEQE